MQRLAILASMALGLAVASPALAETPGHCGDSSAPSALRANVTGHCGDSSVESPLQSNVTGHCGNPKIRSTLQVNVAPKPGHCDGGGTVRARVLQQNAVALTGGHCGDNGAPQRNTL